MKINKIIMFTLCIVIAVTAILIFKTTSNKESIGNSAYTLSTDKESSELVQSSKTSTPNSSEHTYQGTEPSLEENIYTIYKNNKNTSDIIALKQVLSTIGEIDWAKYEKISNKSTMQLLQWIYTGSISNQEQLTNILKAGRSLDGSLTEMYSAILGKAYLGERHRFISCLSTLENTNKEYIISSLAYNLKYSNAQNEKIELNKLLNLSGLSREEMEVTNKLLRAVE